MSRWTPQHAFVRLSSSARTCIALAGLAAVGVAPFEPLSLETPQVRLLAAMLLGASFFSSIPVPLARRRDLGTLWTLPLDETPAPQPIHGMLSGTVVGLALSGLNPYSPFEGVVFGAAAGLLVGATAQLRRYRAASGAILCLAVAGGMLGVGFGDSIGVGGTLFSAACFGFIHAFLHWEDGFRWR